MVSLQSFEHFMVSFQWSIRVKTMENCGLFVFYNNIFFFLTKNHTKQTNRHCLTCYVISMVYALMDHSSQSAREDSLSYCKKETP